MTVSPASKSTGDKDSLLSNVALLYYGEGLTQGEIAQRMQVSRATIVNMLREGRERGIVDIRVNGRHLAGSNLSRAVKEKFDLADVYVSFSGDGSQAAQDRSALLSQLARVVAAAIVDIVEPGDRVGVAWGETIMAVANAMSNSPTEGVEVCQLIGSMISERIPASENCAIQIANRLGARCFTLHSPGIMSSPELAEAMRGEPTIGVQLKRLANLDMTIASVGNLAPDTHLRVADMATQDDLDHARKQGAVGILCCRFLDSNGMALALPPHDRLIASTIDDLLSARKKLLAVCGDDRLDATLGAIKGGLVTHLCVDQSLAEALLASP